MDPATIHDGINLAQQWGVMGVVAVGLVITQILYAWNVKKNAVDPTKEQQKNIDKIWEKYDVLAKDSQDFKIELERRLTRVWAEEKLLPRIDWLNNEFLAFKAEVSSRLTGIEKQLNKGDYK